MHYITSTFIEHPISHKTLKHLKITEGGLSITLHYEIIFIMKLF